MTLPTFTSFDGSVALVTGGASGIVDTAMLGSEMKTLLEGAGVPVIPPSQIAEGVVTALRSGRTGTCFQCLANRPAEPFTFGELAAPLFPTT